METEQWLITIKAMEYLHTNITIKGMKNLDMCIFGMVKQTKLTVAMFNMHSSVKSKH